MEFEVQCDWPDCNHYFDVTWNPSPPKTWGGKYYCSVHEEIIEKAHHDSVLAINGGRSYRCQICGWPVEGTANGEANRFEPGGAV